MREVRWGIGALGVVTALISGSPVWSRVLGAPGPGLEVRIRSVAGDRSGGALVAGTVAGRLDLDRPLSSTGGKDLFVALLDGDGTPRQSLLLDGTGLCDLASATFDPGGNVILAGKFTGTLELDGKRLTAPTGGGESGFVARIDRNGHARWLKQLSAGPVTLLAIYGAAADAHSNVILSGYVDGDTLALDGAELGVANKFALKLDASGAVVWSERLKYGVADTLPPVTDPSGNSIIAFVSEGLEKIHLIKLDPAGKQLWREKLGGGITQELTGLAVDSGGNILLSGRGGLGEAPPEGELGFIAKLDPQGRVVTVRRGPKMAYSGVAVDDHDGVITAGSAPPSASFGGATARGSGPRFVARLDAALRPLWAVRVGGDVDPSIAVGAVPGRAALVAGSFRGTIELGGRRIGGGAGVNAFVGALAP